MNVVYDDVIIKLNHDHIFRIQFFLSDQDDKQVAGCSSSDKNINCIFAKMSWVIYTKFPDRYVSDMWNKNTEVVIGYGIWWF